MGVMGSLIGAIIGAAVAGPVGGFAGAILGAAATTDGLMKCPHCGVQLVLDGSPEDCKIVYCTKCKKYFLTNPDISENKRIILLFGFLGKVAKTIGHLTYEKVNLKNEIFTELNFSIQQIYLANEAFDVALADDKNDIYYYADIIGSLCHPEFSNLCYYTAWAMATCNRSLNPNEEKIFKKLPSHMNIDLFLYEELSEHFRKKENSELIKYFEILDCDPAATIEEIKKAYRKKVAEFHPDKLAGKDISESFIKLANEQMSRINEAYEIIKHYKGF